MRPGYFRNDNRASGGRLVELDFAKCPHCQGTIYRRTRGGRTEFFTRVRGVEAPATLWCSDCGAHVCPTPECSTRCEPFMRRIEAQLRRASFAQAAGLVGG